MKGVAVKSGVQSSFLGQLLSRNFGFGFGLGSKFDVGTGRAFSKYICQCASSPSSSFKSKSTPLLTVHRYLASKASANSDVVEDKGDVESYVQLDVIQPEPKILTEEEVLEKRNKSRLRPYHRRIIHGEVPHPTPTYWTHHTVRYKRRTYGIYGEKSGVLPGLMWPTHEDIEAKLEYERVAYPFTLQEMVDRRKEMRRLEQEEFNKRTEELEKKMGMVEKMKKDIFNRKIAKEKEAAAAKAKREALMEEVRRHFGYTVDPRDEKFQELLEKKEKAQKKALKEAKRIERQQQLMDKIKESFSKEVKIEPKQPKTQEPDLEQDETTEEPKKGK